MAETKTLQNLASVIESCAQGGCKPSNRWARKVVKKTKCAPKCLKTGNHFSLPVLQATPSSSSRTLEGLFELTRRPSRALDSPHALLPELQRYKDTDRCSALGRGGPRTSSTTTDANLDCASVEKALSNTHP